MSKTVKIKRLKPEIKLPTYGSEHASARDIYSPVDATIAPGQTEIIPTGFSVELPIGFGFFITPRSGQSLKTKLRIANSPGLVDADYRGEVGVIIENIGHVSFEIKKGDRVAQCFIAETPRFEFEEAADLSDTARGAGGFGSTGQQ